MDSPQIQLSGAENTQALEDAQNVQDTSNTQNTQDLENVDTIENTESHAQEVEINKTYDAVVNDSQMDAVQDLNSSGTQFMDPSTPAKRNAGFEFLNYLTSPVVEIIVGEGENKTVLTAHQTLLLESPFLAEAVTRFKESGPRRIELPDENVEAFGCFLQFQYTRDYSSNPTESSSQPGQNTGEIDDSGEQLLKHARVYTIAQNLGIPGLKTLAHAKIHRVNSSPRGELEYARYIYTHTSPEDATLRKPVAVFWSGKSHVLRHEVEDEFRKLCLETPEFCFDVLALVLDNKEKHAQNKIETESRTRASGRKRQRGGL